MIHFIMFLLLLVFIVDMVLYAVVVDRFGPQWELWPMSGYYLTWKHRKE